MHRVPACRNGLTARCACTAWRGSSASCSTRCGSSAPTCWVTRSPARYYHPRLLALSLPHFAGGRSAREPGLLAEQTAARLHRPPDPIGYAYQLYAAAGWSSLPWLHRVRHPSLIVAGEKDPSVPLANARLLAARLPDARLHVVDGGGHLFLHDEPQNVVGPIGAFLDEA